MEEKELNEAEVINENNAENAEETKEVEQAEKVNNETEVKEDDSSSLLVAVEKPDLSEDYGVHIEDARKELYAAYSKSRKISNIITIGIMLVAVAAVILLTQQNAVMTVIGWCLAGAAVIGMLVYYIVTKDKFPNKTRAYIKDLTTTLNEQTFKDERFTNVVTNQDEKMDPSEVIGDSVYENIGNISSRNVIRGEFAGKKFTFVEIALQKAQATKKDGPMFVGKYLTLENRLELKGRLLINLKKAEEPVDLPTQIGDLTVLEDDNGFVVYGFKDCDYKKILGTKFISNLKELMPKEHLLNLNVVVWAGKCAAYVSYDDAAMALPFDKPFEKDANDAANADVLKLFESFNEIGK
ncbi:MAG: hypothetical protein MJ217_01335 [Bacilli bacterium]|nr:hypothetical protein [Bacilli bacterium]